MLDFDSILKIAVINSNFLFSLLFPLRYTSVQIVIDNSNKNWEVLSLKNIGYSHRLKIMTLFRIIDS